MESHIRVVNSSWEIIYPTVDKSHTNLIVTEVKPNGITTKIKRVILIQPKEVCLNFQPSRTNTDDKVNLSQQHVYNTLSVLVVTNFNILGWYILDVSVSLIFCFYNILLYEISYKIRVNIDNVQMLSLDTTHLDIIDFGIKVPALSLVYTSVHNFVSYEDVITQVIIRKRNVSQII